MFCSECGAEISDKAVVCPKCGVPVAGKTLVQGGEEIPTHMVGAILTALFCCLIGGVIAIVYASQVSTKLSKGDVAGAKAASKSAKTWIIVNIITGVVVTLLYAIIGIASASSM